MLEPDAYSKYCDARDALDRGDVKGAEGLLVESLKIRAHFKTHEVLGDICQWRGDHDEAFKHFASAYSLNPRSDSAATRYARALLGAGRIDDACTIIAQVLDRNPSYGPAQQLRDTME
jgi:tetratricopeptide (TPR) repeat protein